MAIANTITLLATQTWPQGDARDPLGIWGMRELITGDASGGSIKATVATPVGQAAAYVYSCLAANISIIGTVQVVSTLAKCRILTNWPNIDNSAGINAFATNRIAGIQGQATFTDPVAGAGANGEELIRPNDRFILMYDPRQSNTSLDIMELELSVNVDTVVNAFEVYGYFWDRAVMNTPGGPRHP